jgi:hypothetical protein
MLVIPSDGRYGDEHIGRSDTSAPGCFHVVGAVGELERQLIRAPRCGIAAAYDHPESAIEIMNHERGADAAPGSGIEVDMGLPGQRGSHQPSASTCPGVPDGPRTPRSSQ